MIIKKFLQIHGFIIQVQDFKLLEIQHFTLRTPIDKSSLKIGDTFEMLKRNEQVVVATFNIGDINVNLNTVDVINRSFVAPFTGLDPNENYDIRRVLEKATSTGVPIEVGNETLISNVLNVYTDSNIDGYVASNSLPSYDIGVDVAREEFVGAGNTSNFDGLDPATNKFSFLKFTPSANSTIKLIEGDAVVYQPSGEEIVGLTSGRVYYVDVQPEPAGTQKSRIALYNSRSQIGTASTIQVGEVGIGSTNAIYTYFCSSKTCKS